MVCLTGEPAHSEQINTTQTLGFDLFPKSTLSLSVNRITFVTQHTAFDTIVEMSGLLSI